MNTKKEKNRIEKEQEDANFLAIFFNEIKTLALKSYFNKEGTLSAIVADQLPNPEVFKEFVNTQTLNEIARLYPKEAKKIFLSIGVNWQDFGSSSLGTDFEHNLATIITALFKKYMPVEFLKGGESDYIFSKYQTKTSSKNNQKTKKNYPYRLDSKTRQSMLTGTNTDAPDIVNLSMHKQLLCQEKQWIK